MTTSRAIEIFVLCLGEKTLDWDARSASKVRHGEDRFTTFRTGLLENRSTEEQWFRRAGAMPVLMTVPQQLPRALRLRLYCLKK